VCPSGRSEEVESLVTKSGQGHLNVDGVLEVVVRVKIDVIGEE
jgi:hypothetical protein